MTFRRRNCTTKIKQSIVIWLNEQSSLVEQTGLPKHTFESENWEDFMEYGYLFDGSVDLKRFTLKQKVALLRLIMTRPSDLQKDTGRRLILDLLEAVDQNTDQYPR